jgi:hypothetical protein
MSDEPVQPDADQAPVEPKKLTMKELQAEIDALSTKVDQLPGSVEQMVNQTLEKWKINLNQNIEQVISLALAKNQPSLGESLADKALKIVGDVIPKLIGQGVPNSTNSQINQFAERIELSMFKKMSKDFDKALGEVEHVKVG